MLSSNNPIPEISLNKNYVSKPSVVVYASNPSIWEAEAGIKSSKQGPISISQSISQ
jgi:hypothetical protein